VKSCSGVIFEGNTDEHTDGRRHQTLYSQAQSSLGHGNHPRQTTVAEASRSFDLPPSEIEEWVDEAKKGMENALRAKPLDIKEQYERQLADLQSAYGEAILELRARKKLASRRCRL
jgi:hypothetical protein